MQILQSPKKGQSCFFAPYVQTMRGHPKAFPATPSFGHSDGTQATACAFNICSVLRSSVISFSQQRTSRCEVPLLLYPGQINTSILHTHKNARFIDNKKYLHIVCL